MLLNSAEEHEEKERTGESYDWLMFVIDNSFCMFLLIGTYAFIFLRNVILCIVWINYVCVACIFLKYY